YTVWVLPTSTASSIAAETLPGGLEVFFVRLRLADALGERLRRQRGLVVLAAQLLDGDVARGEDLGARDDPRRPVLVPDPDVIELQVEERIRLLRDIRALELVAEIRRVLRQDAVAKQAEHGLVVPLQPELAIGLGRVQTVEVRHPGVSVAAHAGSRPVLFQALRGPARSRRGGRGRTRARADAGAGPSVPARRSRRPRRGAGRGRASSGRAPRRPRGRVRTGVRRRGGPREGRVERARSRRPPPR